VAFEELFHLRDAQPLRIGQCGGRFHSFANHSPGRSQSI
jgi:hypothetical protein